MATRQQQHPHLQPVPVNGTAYSLTQMRHFLAYVEGLEREVAMQKALYNGACRAYGELRAVLDTTEAGLDQLMEENARLRAQLARLRSNHRRGRARQRDAIIGIG